MNRGKRVTKQDRWIRIYALLDPDTREVRYVGRTYQEISYRRSAHMKRASEGKDTPIYAWLRELASRHKMPKIILVDKIRESCWDDNETKVINKFRSEGVKLLNTYQSGGEDEEIIVVSEDSKESPEGDPECSADGQESCIHS